MTENVTQVVLVHVRRRTLQRDCFLFDVSESAEGSSRAVARVLHVVAFGRFVNLRVELLFRSRVAVLAIVAGLAVRRVAPFVTRFYVRTWSRSVLVLLGTPSFVLIVVKLRAGIALPAQPGWFLAGFRLVVGQNVGGVQPLGVVVQETPFFVEAVRTRQVIGVTVLNGLQLPDIVNGRSQIICAVRERAMGAVLDAEAAVVGVVDAHPRLVILEMVPALRVPGSPVQVRAIVSVVTYARCFVVLRTIHIRTIVKGSVPFTNGPASSLILEMPIEAREWPMLLAFVLQKERTLIHAKLL